jgi:hypothetical protein
VLNRFRDSNYSKFLILTEKRGTVYLYSWPKNPPKVFNYPVLKPLTQSKMYPSQSFLSWLVGPLVYTPFFVVFFVIIWIRTLLLNFFPKTSVGYKVLIQCHIDFNPHFRCTVFIENRMTKIGFSLSTMKCYSINVLENRVHCYFDSLKTILKALISQRINGNNVFTAIVI